MLVPPSVLMATSAVVLDVDGTIAGPDHRITPRTQAAMAGIERLGVPVVLATGRSRANVLDVAATVGLRTPGVSCNDGAHQSPKNRILKIDGRNGGRRFVLNCVAKPQIRISHYRRQDHLRAVHQHDRASGRRHQADGR